MFNYALKLVTVSNLFKILKIKAKKKLILKHYK